MSLSLKCDEVHGLSRVADHRNDAPPHREIRAVFAVVDSLALENEPGWAGGPSGSASRKSKAGRARRLPISGSQAGRLCSLIAGGCASSPGAPPDIAAGSTVLSGVGTPVQPKDLRHPCSVGSGLAPGLLPSGSGRDRSRGLGCQLSHRPATYRFAVTLVRPRSKEPHDLVPGALIMKDVEARNWFNACGPPHARGERQDYRAQNREERPAHSDLGSCVLAHRLAFGRERAIAPSPSNTHLLTRLKASRALSRAAT